MQDMQTQPLLPASELLTAAAVGRRLGVDTSTVYRMAADGRLPAVKVGRQWRIPSEAFERTLAVGVPVASISPRLAEAAVALVAPALGVMMVVTDMTGRPITSVANPCPWFDEHCSEPEVLAACIDEWQDLAQDLSFTPTYRTGPSGFRCARAFIRRDDRLVGMVLAGGLGATRQPDGVEVASDGFHHLDAAAEARVLQVLPHVAAALSSP